jgi:glyceraldehyde 3-phosphate dehydrogenase
MMLRVGLNGAGRIGRALLRMLRDDPQVRLVAINDLVPLPALAQLLRHDSLHGAFPGTVEDRPGVLVIDGRSLRYTSATDPEQVGWAEAGVDVVVEATGRFTRGEQARRHLGGSTRRVLVSAVGDGADATIVLGVHSGAVAPGQQVIAAASCTTHAAALPLLLLQRWYGIEAAEVLTVHCTTGSQPTIDLAHPDPRRARSALLSMIPTTSSARRGLEAALPELAGRLACRAVRVPVASGSLVWLVAQTRRPVDEPAALGARFREAAASELAGRLGVSDEPLVSIDYTGDPRSGVVDLPLLERIGAHLVRAVVWYDNEWGYASRLCDLLRIWCREGVEGES